MNTRDIDRLMNGTPYYRGTFSCDTLPPPMSTGDGQPRLMIVNTDPSYEAGEHWIAIYVDSTGHRGEFFDSFGRRPPPVFEAYMNVNCWNYWSFNERQLQSITSSMCGYYCVYYCMLRSAGIDMFKIVKSFTNDTGFNDVLVHGFLCD